ncbi:protein-tyrosine phosphatase [Microbacterium resistens]|uniref:Protein-tyrosine phosphatase n=1 Tax=Microbacterium resistens TaxID=156977 RepID=A0ABU1SHD7_9MICO|nr:tyrosine-protein phosphatase [Microbacterium resistens]MDR6869005.1 protein-tyrosine phosphatase [Microbacterium resistens]
MTALIAGTHNSRDTGGTPLADGGATRGGVLFRSDALFAVTEDGLRTIADGPIGAVVDFRTDAERADAPNRLPSSRPIRTVSLSLLEGAMAAPRPEEMSPEAMREMMSRIPTLPDLYVAMLEHGASAFADVARLIARPAEPERGGVLVHCTAGKDRTGVATALLLDVVGAERAAVVADYASSEANLAGEWADRMLARAEEWGVPIVPAVTALVTATPPAAIEAALGWVDARGGAAAYLQDGGLTAAELDDLRGRLIG